MDGEVWNSAFIYYREIIQPFTMRANIPNTGQHVQHTNQVFCTYPRKLFRYIALYR